MDHGRTHGDGGDAELMAEAVPVRCPGCLRENGYTVPVFPCACGSPVAAPLDRAVPPVVLTRRSWADSWVTVRCAACGQDGEWPRPEVGCGDCGTVVQLSVLPPRDPDRDPDRESDPDRDHERGPRGDGARPGSAAPSVPGRRAPRPAFRPVTIRTARDAVAAAALYLSWLGFPDVRRPDGHPAPSAAVDLRAPGLVAQVDPSTAAAGARAVECVWLNGLTASAACVYFSLAGYTEEARARAEELGVPLFIMDLTGTPQPVNDPADRLVATGP
ncbi:hypothetical protein AB0P12_23425 [Streptomyces subrutilus]|uniref:hypothetical protein n=1 Tax=Streptomyces subrutilus TaxID=36818 RepID=UPI0034477246